MPEYPQFTFRGDLHVGMVSFKENKRRWAIARIVREKMKHKIQTRSMFLEHLQKMLKSKGKNILPNGALLQMRSSGKATDNYLSYPACYFLCERAASNYLATLEKLRESVRKQAGGNGKDKDKEELLTPPEEVIEEWIFRSTKDYVTALDTSNPGGKSKSGDTDEISTFTEYAARSLFEMLEPVYGGE